MAPSNRSNASMGVGVVGLEDQPGQAEWRFTWHTVGEWSDINMLAPTRLDWYSRTQYAPLEHWARKDVTSLEEGRGFPFAGILFEKMGDEILRKEKIVAVVYFACVVKRHFREKLVENGDCRRDFEEHH